MAYACQGIYRQSCTMRGSEARASRSKRNASHDATPAASQLERLDSTLSFTGSSAARTRPSAPKPVPSPRVTGHARHSSRRAIRRDGRLAFALLLSLLLHSLLLNLIFGGQGLGRPGFGFPWGDRRIEVPDLRLLLVPTHVTEAEPANPSLVEPLQQAAIEQPVASAPAAMPLV